MGKKALLIGSQTGGLSGVYNDVNRMVGLLDELTFTIDRCVEKTATREGILNSYQKLIRDSKADDTVVIFYSGHGGYVANPDYHLMTETTAPVPRYYQFIVPYDIDDSKENDFKGILSFELSSLLASLTKKTKNVTVILDCCHSARMSRDLDLTPKAWQRPCVTDISFHLRQLKEKGYSPEARHIESNPFAVRLVAAGVTQSAYEYTNANNERAGILTESFAIALKEAQGLPVTWEAMGNRIRERVLSIQPTQRPEIEGPIKRRLFDLKEAEQIGVLPVIMQNKKPALRGGAVHGITSGDEYSVMPMTAAASDPQKEIAKATVTKVEGALSWIQLNYNAGYSEVPTGAQAFPTKITLRKCKIAVKGEGKAFLEIVKAIEKSQHVQIAAAEDNNELLAILELVDDRIILKDRFGLPLLAPKLFGEDTLYETIINLEKLARAQMLLTMKSGEGRYKLEQPFTVEWGLVVQNQPKSLNLTGEHPFNGDKIYVRVQNLGTKKIYVSIFDAGVDGKITLLTNSEPSGIEIMPTQEYVLGCLEGEGLVGLQLFWPESIPQNGPRKESIIVIVSDIPQDLRSLEMTGIRKAASELISPLQQMLNHVAHGGQRDLQPQQETVTDVRYSINHIDFYLNPEPAPERDQKTFLFDERPDSSVLVMSSKSAGMAPSNVAIRLLDLIVHNNRALFSTDIRIDAVIVTSQTAGNGKEFYQPQTWRFSGIKDGDRLPFNNMIIYHGPVANFIDMALWISRDQKGSLDLADMFKTQLNSEEFKKATLTLGGLAIAAPQAAAVVAALGAGATIVNIGYNLLSKAVGNSIGLYRTSFLMNEQLGVGRHPNLGLMRVQDFSFGYEIIDVD